MKPSPKLPQQLMVLVFILASTLMSQAQQVLTVQQDTLKMKNVEAILYTQVKDEVGLQKAPLIVGLGGSEGGNAWASKYWQAQREDFLKRGYAFLAVAYFGSENTPALLNQIELEDVYAVIAKAKEKPFITPDQIFIVGGSRGADLALLLASYYNDIKGVVALSPSHVVFPGHTQEFNTSSFTYKGKEFPFIPVNETAIPFLMEGNLRKTFEAMLQDTIAEAKSFIPVENIKGPVLFITGKADEIIPSTMMAEKMISRLKQYKFKYPYSHIALEGPHAEPTKHFDLVFKFLEGI